MCYLDFGEYGLTYLITAFKKNEQQNITEAEKNNLKKQTEASYKFVVAR